ncbi:MAG TPA: RNA-binding protein [Polyangia bacterium]|nr:RNA-binding protein [Polyangia bacterium]
MGTRLFVGNLSFNTNEDDLRDLFGQSGTVVDVKVVTDRETGRPRGFAFVEMSSQSEATQAIEQVNGRELGGRTLRVNEAEERTSRPRPSGGGSRRW